MDIAARLFRCQGLDAVARLTARLHEEALRLRPALVGPRLRAAESVADAVPRDRLEHLLDQVDQIEQAIRAASGEE